MTFLSCPLAVHATLQSVNDSCEEKNAVQFDVFCPVFRPVPWFATHAALWCPLVMFVGLATPLTSNFIIIDLPQSIAVFVCINYKATEHN